MNINKYPDGTSYVSLDDFNFDLIKYNKILYESTPKYFRINTYEDLWHLNQYVDLLNHHSIFHKNIIITNLIDAQADRRFDDNQSSGLKLVCNFLNKLKANFTIYHPHNAEVVESLFDNVTILNNSSFIKKVLNKLHEFENTTKDKIESNLILLSTDAGGFKPLIKLCDEIGWKGETFSASKSRRVIDGKSSLVQMVDRQDFLGKDILIVDDISVYGGTFKGISKLLKERNCGKIYLSVSHMTVQNLGKDPVTNYFDQVYTTNSKFDSYTSDDLINNLNIINLFK